MHQRADLFLSCPQKSASCTEILIENAKIRGISPISKDGQILSHRSIASLEIPAEHAEKVLLASRQDQLSFAFPTTGGRKANDDRRVVMLNVDIVRGDDPITDVPRKEHLDVIRLGEPGNYADVIVRRAKVLFVNRLPLAQGQDRRKAVVTLDIPAAHVKAFLRASKRSRLLLVRPLAEDHRAVTIGIDLPGTGPVGFILPGDSISLDLSRRLKRSLRRSVKRTHTREETIVRDGRVLAVKYLPMTEPKSRRVLVALDLSADDAEKTITASTQGQWLITVQPSHRMP
jgi:Flp pilus assembly protein CpaB